MNPEGSSTTYYFEYGLGSSGPYTGKTSASSAGSGSTGLAVSKTVTGLQPGTSYHYRVVAESSLGGTTNGEVQQLTTTGSTRYAAVPATQSFDGTSGSISSFNSAWSAMSWANASSAKGEDTPSGWKSASSFPKFSGASYNPALFDTNVEKVVIATMAANPGSAERYFSLMLDMPTPTTTRAGYELRFTYVSANTYTVTLFRWLSGSQTELVSKSSYTFSNGDSLALADEGSTVAAYANTGEGFVQILSAADSSFKEGTAGIEAAGNGTRLTNFKVTPSIYQLVAKHSSKCMDVEGGSTSPGAAIQQWSCSPASEGFNQKFNLIPISPSYYQVVVRNSGECLDVSAASTSPGAALQQYTCLGEGQANQIWNLKPISNGYYELIAKHSGLCADVIGSSKENGAKLQQYTCLGEGQANQLWKPEAVG